MLSVSDIKKYLKHLCVQLKFFKEPTTIAFHKSLRVSAWRAFATKDTSLDCIALVMNNFDDV
jgi:hypothetical protein